MPNIGVVLKQEIARLSRREIRGEVQAMRKASAQYRRHIAALKRQVSHLEREMSMLKRRILKGSLQSAASSSEKFRFVAKGLKSQRKRLGLSAAEYGRLVNVSAQSVYNWEQGHSSPRAVQLAAIATLRGMGKREVGKRLEELGAKPGSAAKVATAAKRTKSGKRAKSAKRSKPARRAKRARRSAKTTGKSA
ncbi:MAG: helix-turn-helix transcriptional regulator [Betaproteobacteria bacterium]